MGMVLQEQQTMFEESLFRGTIHILKNQIFFRTCSTNIQD